MSQIDKRIKVNTIIENQLPEFVVSDFPNATEFLKQYYISQEFQGGASDLINNFDQYLKVDNLVPEVVVGVTTISADVSITDTTITVPSTKGFPSEYGLLKIDDEIISYTGITSTTFTGCIRGFSGVSGYNVGVSSSLLEINRESLEFDDTTAEAHTSGSTLTNLSVLFIQEFFKKLKKTFLPGLENNDFSEDLDVGNFVKFSRSFYQSKGIEESIKILFKVLYGVDSKVLDLEGNQAVDTLFYSAENPVERYSTVDTIREQGNVYLTAGTSLLSTEGNVMLEIIADTCGRHDTLGGACAAESNTVRYALDKKTMHSCRDSWLLALAEDERFDMSKRDLTHNINFFMNVPVTPAGGLTFEDGISDAGKYVELIARMKTIVLISNCPQLIL